MTVQQGMLPSSAPPASTTAITLEYHHHHNSHPSFPTQLCHYLFSLFLGLILKEEVKWGDIFAHKLF